MKYYYLLIISFFLFSCSSSGDNNEDPVAQNEETDAIDQSLFYGAWKLAIQVQNTWYHIEGCESYYSLTITENTVEEGLLADLTMTDRIGLSVDLHCQAKEFESREDGSFSWYCQNLYDSNNEVVFSGTYSEARENWEGPIIEVERNDFANMLIWGIFPEEEITRIILFQNKSEGKEPMFTDKIDCDLGFDENEASEYIPEEGLNEDNFTDYMAALLVSNVYLNDGLREGDYESFLTYGDHFLLFVDRQSGLIPELVFFSIDKWGNLLDEKSIKGEMDLFEDGMHYLIEEDGKILCRPGQMEVDEVNTDMKFVAEDTRVWLDEEGMIQIEKQ